MKRPALITNEYDDGVYGMHSGTRRVRFEFDVLSSVLQIGSFLIRH